MILANVDLLPVVVAAVIQFLFGWVWYSKLFGDAWMDANSCRKEDCKCCWTTLAASFVVAFVTAYVFAGLLNHFVVSNPIDGAWLGFWIWLGFVATKLFSGYLWTKQTFTGFLICAAHQLIILVFLGYFLTWWK